MSIINKIKPLAKLAVLVAAGCMLLSTSQAVAGTVKKTVPIPAQKNRKYISRLNHAQELLGKFYPKSIVRNGEKVKDIAEFIQEKTKKALPEKWKHRSKEIADTI